MVSRWRQRLARRLDPAAQSVQQQPAPEPAQLERPEPSAWPIVCHQFALRMLSLVEQLRPEMDHLELHEDDAATLERLYRVDHGITRLRRVAGYLQILSGADDEQLTGYRSSLVDVIREAESAIEHYKRVNIGRVAELGVVEYAAKDVAWLVAALIDNATAYSPAAVVVSAHLLDNGGIMMRIEDSGIGIDPRRVENLNAVLAGAVPDVTDDIARHTGFPIIHRLARKHGIRVRLASRPGAGGGTVAMVLLPPELLCEMPPEFPAAAGQGRHREASWPRGVPSAPELHGAHLSLIQRPSGGRTAPPETALPRPELAPRSSRPSSTPSAQPSAQPQPRLAPQSPLPAVATPDNPAQTTKSGLPRRESQSLRTTSPLPAPLADGPSDVDYGDDPVELGGGGEQPSVRPAPRPQARSFAEDLDSFTAGVNAARQRSAPPVADQPDSIPEGQPR
ncbi:sensor histidine kinase [Fodinicola acaciae]|uniref:sensor histidine kinase n=1 Tax=Fodinicola acaciae TaxID=2681555 RepID=UPI0013D5EA48|nr:ATP-binding protein [Fodinicola acaciae]